MQKVLVLGGTGFVGRHVAEVLHSHKYDVRIASRQTGYDLRKSEDLEAALTKYRPDAIVNCAANVGSLNFVSKYAATVIDDNTRLIMVLYGAVQKIDSNILIVNPIANCAYPGHIALYEEDRIFDGPLHDSVLPFGASRRLLLEVAECFRLQHQIRSINLLVPNMYGPYDSTDPDKAHALNALANKFVCAEKTKSAVSVWGSGKVVREWLFARDFAKIVYEILSRSDLLLIDTPINIGQECGISIEELVQNIQSLFANEIELSYDRSMQDGAPSKIMSSKLFRKYFPSFEFQRLREGIKETLAYYESIYS